MKVVWVNRSFLDYRVPVYAELDKLLNGNLSIIYSKQYTPERVRKKITAALGERAIALDGEKILFSKGDIQSGIANASAEICYQPGLLHEIRKCKPDVIIGEGFFKWTTAAMIYRLLHGTPLIISYERTQHTERNSQWYRTAYRKLVLNLTSGVCCNGQLSADYVASLGFPREKIVTGTMAADSEMLSAQCASISLETRAEKKKLGHVSPVFLYVGQLIERKGVIWLLKAWKKLHQLNSSTTASLLIVGDGPERENLEAYVRANLLQNIFFAGAVDYDNIAEYYAMADVFVMPTLEDNWSLVVPEAMACGLPVLCSKYNGCWPELVGEGVNGFVFDPLLPDDCANKLQFCIEKSSQLTSMGRESLSLIAAFSPKLAATAILRACLLALHTSRV